MVIVEFLVVVPQGIAATSRYAGDMAQFADDAADRTVIAVVVVHVEEGMGQRTSGEVILILRVFTDELRDVGQLGCLNLKVGGILESVVVAYRPQFLGPRVGGRHHLHVGDGTHVGRCQPSGEEVIVRAPA